MCLYPKRMINKKYTATEKNGGVIPTLPVTGTTITELGKRTNTYDERIIYVNIPCGQCEECRKQKANDWQIRLTEELKEWKYAYFITLTFSPEALREIKFKHGVDECNAAAGYAIRHMLERYRKDKKTSLKHWLVTELGHEGTERIHCHGLLFNNEPLEFKQIEEKKDFYTWKYWKYGQIYVGQYCTNRTINYIVKYITKIDTDHKGFIGQIFASPGIGKNYINNLPLNRIEYGYKPRNSANYYLLPNGCKVKLPTYYKNKIYTEEEREKIWRDFLDENKISITGTEYSLHNMNEKTIKNIIKVAQEKNRELEYGDDSKEYRKRPYNLTKRMLQSEERKKRKHEMEIALLAKNYVYTEKLLKKNE